MSASMDQSMQDEIVKRVLWLVDSRDPVQFQRMLADVIEWGRKLSEHRS